jgi:hypothetical protein
MRKTTIIVLLALVVGMVTVFGQTYSNLDPIENAAPFVSGNRWSYTHANTTRSNFIYFKNFVDGVVDCDNASTSKLLFDTTTDTFTCGTDQNSGGGGGDVVGPASATDNAIVRYDSTTGKLVQNSGISIADGASGTLAGTNSGDVTLAGSPNYLTLAAQVITRALIDLTSHVTGRLPYANLVQSAAATKFVCRGSAAGSGDWQECDFGSGLSLSGTTLSASGGGGGAPDNATYVTLGTNGTLTNERVLTAGTGISLTDAGAGSTITIAATGGSGGDSIVRKSADETVNNSAVLQNDDALLFAVDASSTYWFEIYLLLESVSNAADWQLTFTEPSGTSMFWGPDIHNGTTMWDETVTEASTPGVLRIESDLLLFGSRTGSVHGVRISGIAITSGTSGNITVQWAQSTATASNSVVKANSFVRYRKIS